MEKGWIWGGFAALLAVGVLSGYAPDLMLASALSGARAEGLVTPAAPVDPKRDARPAYQAAARKYPDGWNLLGNDFARQVKTPAPHVVKYLDAMAEASKLPECSRLPEDWNAAYYGRTEADVIAKAAKALAVRADDAPSLLAAARIAGHLGAQSRPLAVGQWALLVPQILDRAKALGLPSGPVVAALGPPLSPREALRRHVSAEVETFERTREKDGASASRTRDEAACLRFWRDLFAKVPEGEGFADALRPKETAIEQAEGHASGSVDLTPVTGVAPDRWAKWAALVQKADVRLKAGG